MDSICQVGEWRQLLFWASGGSP